MPISRRSFFGLAASLVVPVTAAPSQVQVDFERDMLSAFVPRAQESFVSTDRMMALIEKRFDKEVTDTTMAIVERRQAQG